MKKLYKIISFCVFIMFFMLASCKKDNPYTPEREALLIKEWIDTNIKNEKDIQKTFTGLSYIVDKVGIGPDVQVGDTVTVKFIGSFVDGTIFDASAYYSGGTFTFVHKDIDQNKQMIQGWEEAIAVLKWGGRAVFLIPSDKAFGAAGKDGIPPYSPLVFTIEIVNIAYVKKEEDPFAIYTPEREAGLIKEWIETMNSNNKDIKTTTTGIKYIVEKIGSGELVKSGNTVTVKYTGMFLDGQIFDASAYHGDGTYTYKHKTDRLIQGWEEGIEVLNKGASAAFLIPSAKAYGTTGQGPIPPNTPLIFVIEVIDIK